MEWLAGIVVLILLVVSPGFRLLVGGLIMLAALVGGSIFLWDKLEGRLSLTRIQRSDLVFEDVKLNSGYSSYTLAGRVKNNSPKYILTEVTFVVTMKDCFGQGQSQNCTIIEESNSHAYLNVPPGQARDFNEYIYFSSLKPKGHLEWSYSVSQIKGM